MNDVEGRRTLLWEMNGTEGIEDGNKNQRGHYSINHSFMAKAIVCISTEIESNQEFIHSILTRPLDACCCPLPN